MNLDKYYDKSFYLIFGVILIILGFILIFLNKQFYEFTILILVYLFLIIGIKNFLTYFFKKNKKQSDFNNSLFHLIFAFILSSLKELSLSIVPVIMGIYFLLNFILQLINTIILIRNKDKGSLYKFVLSFCYLIVSLILIFKPLNNIKELTITSGIYFVLLGLNYIYDYISDLIPKRFKNKIKRRFRFSLPVIFEAIIPYRVLNYINRYLEEDDLKKVKIVEKDNDLKPDMEIIVHVSPNGFNRLGHLDIWFDDEVISYGNYDSSSKKFFEVFGDGVIFTCNRDKYIPFVIDRNKKTLFVFGLKLNENQKKRVRKYISNLKDNLVDWKCPYEIDKDKSHNDYASALYKKTKAKFYKFKKGNLKTYFILGNNCCYLADRIIGRSGLDLLKMNGLITPGTYYEYLNKEFSKKDSIVVSRNIYNEKRKGDKNDKKKIRSR